MALAVDWALYSKNPGDLEDYRVLESTQKPITSPRFNADIRRHLPGTPPVDADQQTRSDALPWVWFGPATPANEPCLSIGRVEFGVTADRAGRRTDPVRYCRARWSDVATVRPSYSALGDAVARVTFPPMPPDPLDLAVDALSASELACRVEHVDFERAAIVAALLLESPVVLRKAGPLPIEERLAVFDAVAALLPYGLRADLAVATWAEPSPSFRLSFGRYAEPTKRAIDWRPESVSPDLGEGLAGRYHRLLTGLWDLDGAAPILEYLLDASEPLSFERPEAALHHLLAFDPPAAAVLSVERGEGGLAAVRALFDAGEVPLGNRSAPELARFLLLEGDTSDLSRVEPHWDVVGNVQDLFLSTLSLEARGERSDTNVGFAREHGQLDPLLADLLSPVEAAHRYLADLSARGGQTDTVLTHALERAVTMDDRLARKVAARAIEQARAHVDTRSPHAWPRVRAALAASPDAAYQFLGPFAEDRSCADIVTFVQWLTAQDAPLALAVRPLRSLVKHRSVSAVALGMVEVRWFPVVLGLAASLGDIRTAVRVIAAWLPVAVEAYTAGERLPAAFGLDDDVLGNLPLQARAQLDCVSLLHAVRPVRPLEHVLATEAAPGYVLAFERAYWREALDPVRPALAQGLAGHLTGRRWMQPAKVAERVLLLCRRLVQPQKAPEDAALPPELLQPLAAAVLDGVRRDSSMLDRQAFTEWWEQRLVESPEHRETMRLHRLRKEVPPEAPPFQTAMTVARALVEGTSIDEIFTLLQGQHALRHPRNIGLFLDDLSRALERADIGSEDSWQLRRTIVEGMRAGQCGMVIAKSSAEYLADVLPQETIDRMLFSSSAIENVSEEWRSRLLDVARLLVRSGSSWRLGRHRGR